MMKYAMLVMMSLMAPLSAQALVFNSSNCVSSSTPVVGDTTGASGNIQCATGSLLVRFSASSYSCLKCATAGQTPRRNEGGGVSCFSDTGGTYSATCSTWIESSTNVQAALD